MKITKKIIVLMMIIIMVLSMTACTTKEKTEINANIHNLTNEVGMGDEWNPWVLGFDWDSLHEKSAAPQIRGFDIPVDMAEMIVATYDHAVVSYKVDTSWTHERVSMDGLMSVIVDNSLVTIELYRTDEAVSDMDAIKPNLPESWVGTVRGMLDAGYCYLVSYKDLVEGTDVSEGADFDLIENRIRELGKPDMILPYSVIPNKEYESKEELFGMSAGAILVWQYDGSFYAIEILDVYLDPDDVRCQFYGAAYGNCDVRDTGLYEGYAFSAMDLCSVLDFG